MKKRKGGGGEEDREKKRPAKDASREERWLSPAPEGAIPLLSSSPSSLSKRCFLSPLLFIHLSLSLSLLLSLRSLVLRWLARSLVCSASRLTSHLKPTNTSAFVYAYRVNAATAHAITALCTPLFAFRSSVSTGRIGRFLSFSRSITTRFPKSSLPLCPAIYVHFAEKIYMQSSSTAVCVCVCMCVHISEHSGILE